MGLKRSKTCWHNTWMVPNRTARWLTDNCWKSLLGKSWDGRQHRQQQNCICLIGLPAAVCSQKTTHWSYGHRLSKWSNILIVGPHLSGLEFCGHKVTSGNVTCSMGYVMVSMMVRVGCLLQAESELYFGTWYSFVCYLSWHGFQFLISKRDKIWKK